MSAAPAAGPLTVATEWGRIGVTGFGGPPAHIALLRRLTVARRGWLTPEEFESALAACNLLPGPASTQLAIFCALRVAGRSGALIGGLCFVVPAVLAVTALAAVFLGGSPPAVIRGAGAGAGAAVAAVALSAGLSLAGPSRRAAGGGRSVRWTVEVAAGGLAAWLAGAYVVLVLIAAGLAELAFARASAAGRRGPGARPPGPLALSPAGALLTVKLAAATAAGIGALGWVAIKVGLLSYGGGFVIVPLMQHDAVDTYHWMSQGGFLDAVALGQVTPGPVVATVAAVGYAAHGVGGALLAATVAFAPSFAIVMLAGPRFDALRRDPRAQAFLAGAGPAAIGAILGAAIPLAGALHEAWQFVLLAAAAVALFTVRLNVVTVLVGAGAVGAVIGVAGGAVPG